MQKDFDRALRREHWKRVGAVAGVFLFGLVSLWALVELVATVVFFLGGLAR